MLVFALSLCLAACTRLMRILFTRCQQATHRSVCVFIEYMAACLDSNYWDFFGLFSEPGGGGVIIPLGCNIMLCHHVTHLHSLAHKTGFSTAALLLLAVLAQAHVC